MTSDLPLVVIGGTLCDVRIWSPVLGDGDAIKIVAGQTLGGDISATGDMTTYASDLLQDLPPRFCLIGFSLGGLIALEMIAQGPDRIAGLALICAGFGAETEAGAKTRRADEVRAEKIGMAGHAAQDIWPRFSAQSQAHAAEFLDMAQVIGLDLYRCQNDLAISRHDSLPRLGKIDVPVLLVTGDKDPLCPPMRHEIAEGKIANVKRVIIERAGHMICFDKLDELSRLIDEWTAEVSGMTSNRARAEPNLHKAQVAS